MRILLVTATDLEVEVVLASFRHVSNPGPRLRRCSAARHEVDVLTTGVGMVATATWCSRTLAQPRYDLAFNLGVCGSFDPELPPGSVVHVVRDTFSELGAEDGDDFLTLGQLGLQARDEFPFRGGSLVNDAPPVNVALAALPAVTGITVNTAHGSDASIARIVERLHPQVESMEGAAFMYACLVAGVPFAQIRAVSNRVERRNRPAWNMPEALRALAQTAVEILEQA